jgi:ketosteroid isomerase-like protein
MKTPLIASLALFSAVIGNAAAGPAGDQAALIRSARAEQNAAIARHDLPGIASFWTDNVTICRGLGVQVSGKADYLALFRADDPATSLVYERIPDEVVVGTDWPLAFETGHWVGRRAGQTLISGRYSAQWVRDGERWLIRGEVYVALEGKDDGKRLPSAPASGAEAGAVASPVAIRELLADFLTHNSDPARHEAFWADDVVYTSATGVVRTKPELLVNVRRASAAVAKGPAGPAPTYTAEDIVIRPNDGFAALTFRLVVRNGDGSVDNYRNSGTLVFRDRRWQVITWQATKIAPPETK